jgi:hypothetical protein
MYKDLGSIPSTSKKEVLVKEGDVILCVDCLKFLPELKEM